MYKSIPQGVLLSFYHIIDLNEINLICSPADYTDFHRSYYGINKFWLKPMDIIVYFMKTG